LQDFKKGVEKAEDAFSAGQKSKAVMATGGPRGPISEGQKKEIDGPNGEATLLESQCGEGNLFKRKRKAGYGKNDENKRGGGDRNGTGLERVRCVAKTGDVEGVFERQKRGLEKITPTKEPKKGNQSPGQALKGGGKSPRPTMTVSKRRNAKGVGWRAGKKTRKVGGAGGDVPGRPGLLRGREKKTGNVEKMERFWGVTAKNFEGYRPRGGSGRMKRERNRKRAVAGRCGEKGERV